MKQSDIFRDNADNCLQLAEREDSPHTNAFAHGGCLDGIADEQDWLDGEIPPVKVGVLQKQDA